MSLYSQAEITCTKILQSYDFGKLNLDNPYLPLMILILNCDNHIDNIA